jgi:hypothetical protein
MSEHRRVQGPPCPSGLSAVNEDEALGIWRRCPAWYRYPVQLKDGTWYLSSVLSGFIGPPEPPRGVWADSEQEAWQMYRLLADNVGCPVQIGNRWLLPRPVRSVNPDLAAETAALYERMSPVTAPRSPGSSAAAARLTDADRHRIDQQVRKRAKQAHSEQLPQPRPPVQQSTLFE